jgi:hypothetical protein
MRKYGFRISRYQVEGFGRCTVCGRKKSWRCSVSRRATQCGGIEKAGIKEWLANLPEDGSVICRDIQNKVLDRHYDLPDRQEFDINPLRRKQWSGKE